MRRWLLIIIVSFIFISSSGHAFICDTDYLKQTGTSKLIVAYQNVFNYTIRITNLWVRYKKCFINDCFVTTARDRCRSPEDCTLAPGGIMRWFTNEYSLFMTETNCGAGFIAIGRNSTNSNYSYNDTETNKEIFISDDGSTGFEYIRVDEDNYFERKS